MSKGLPEYIQRLFKQRYKSPLRLSKQHYGTKPFKYLDISNLPKKGICIVDYYYDNKETSTGWLISPCFQRRNNDWYFAPLNFYIAYCRVKKGIIV